MDGPVDQPKYVAILTFVRLRHVNVDDFDILLWPLLICLRIFNLVDNIQALNRATKYCMLLVEPRL